MPPNSSSVVLGSLALAVKKAFCPPAHAHPIEVSCHDGWEAVGLVLDDRAHEGGGGVRYDVNITHSADRAPYSQTMLWYRKNFDLCLGKGRMKTNHDRVSI